MSVMYILSYLLKPQTQTKNQKMLKQEACKTVNFNDPIPQNI